MGLALLGAVACTTTVEPEKSEPVTSIDSPALDQSLPVAPPSDQVQAAILEQPVEEETVQSLAPSDAKPLELPDPLPAIASGSPAAAETAPAESDAHVDAPAGSISIEDEVTVVPDAAAVTTDQAGEIDVAPEQPTALVAEIVESADDSETNKQLPIEPQKKPLEFHVGGQARMLMGLDNLSSDVSEADIAKTITIDIRRDKDFRYYYDPLQPLEVPAGETVKFIVRNIYVDSSDCW